MRFFKKEIPSNPLYLASGKRAPFLTVKGVGLLSTDDKALLDELDRLIFRRIGGVVEIKESDFLLLVERQKSGAGQKPKSEKPIQNPVADNISVSEYPTGLRYTVSILCFNNIDITKRCLDSLFKFTGNEAEVIIHNNGSTDGTKEYLNSLKPCRLDNLRIIHNAQNLGFLEPNEAALKLAKGEFFVMLNNDTEIRSDKWLSQLSKPFEANAKIGIVGRNEDVCCQLNDEFIGGPGERIEYVEASCCATPTALVRKFGLFPSYLQFAYWEDTDLSLRLREQGYELKLVKVDVDHKDRASTSRKVNNLNQIMENNKVEMFKRWRFYIRRRDFKRRIMVKRTEARGDVLLITPVLRAMRERWPQAEIDVSTKCPEMLHGFDGVTTAVKENKYYDFITDLDLAYESRPDVHIVKAYADVAGVNIPANWNMEMFPTDLDLEWGLRKSRGLKVALIHGGVTTWPGKNWPVERMETTVKKLKRLGYFTVAVGARNSPRCGCDDSVAGQTTPQQMFALAKHASLFIGMDSMPQHVMSAADVPSVVLFGPTNPDAIIRPCPSIIPVFGDVSKIPCIGEHGRRKSSITHSLCGGECIRSITVGMVMKAVEKLDSGNEV